MDEQFINLFQLNWLLGNVQSSWLLMIVLYPSRSRKRKKKEKLRGLCGFDL